ncbi:glycerate kinase [Sporosarcina sp. FA9]|uniref:glycerate kinase n=1 Tax=Sporosarcina sp. FA9 TaxID=3413030 RepID=UPI003F65C4BB
MKVIIIPDSFKGSLTAAQAAKAMAEGIYEYDPSIIPVLLSGADGGEGTMRSLVEATDGQTISVLIQDPLGRKREAEYGVLGDGETCVIELAEASGLLLLSKIERNPLMTTSFGTGELILDALNAGFRKFIIGLGGSATNDGGMGMLSALGMKFRNKEGFEIPQGGGALSELIEIDSTHFDKRILESAFIIACDVENSFVGPDGASAVFGPQKGASPEMVKTLDGNLRKLADIVKDSTGISLHNKKGAGAAGGAGGAFQAFFQGQMKQGIEVVLDAISFEKHIQDADLIVTGEGKTDVQTLSGKTPFGIAKVAKEKEIPVILISGTLEKNCKKELSHIFTELHSITDETVSSEDSMNDAYRLLRKKTKYVIAEYFKKII